MQPLTGDLDFARRVPTHGQYLWIGVEYQSHDRYDTTVPQLILVLRDLFPARLSREASASLPRLPALEQWLARGDVESGTGGWRQWLQREYAGGNLAALPSASIAGAAVAGLPADQPLWYATPMHLVAGLDTVRVHPAGLLQLDLEEQQLLQGDFARVFEGSGWSLHATGRRELLLAGGPVLAAAALRSTDPAQWLGADPRAGMPGGQGSEPLRRLGSELEMWLHEHPVNRIRLGRRQLNANALWLWGGGATVAAGAGVAPPGAPPGAPRGTPRGAAAWADELFIDGLARLAGLQLQPPAGRWPQAAAGPQPAGEVIAVCELGAVPDERSLRSMESDWIAPALAQWRRGPARRITLLAGNRAVTLGRAPLRTLWRRLRRTRPWWETLLAC